MSRGSLLLLPTGYYSYGACVFLHSMHELYETYYNSSTDQRDNTAAATPVYRASYSRCTAKRRKDAASAYTGS